MCALPTLTAVLLADDAAPQTGPADAEVEPLLHELWHKARAAWPGLEVSAPCFVRYLGERLPSQAEPVAALRRMATADLYLCCACAQGRTNALARFDQHFLTLIPALQRMDPSPAFQDEVRQRIREKLFVDQRLKEYAGRGKLEGWVQVLALRVGLDLRRSAARRGEERLDQALVGEADPELSYLYAHYQEEFRAAFSAALAALSDDGRALLRLYYVDGVTSERIGALLKVSRPTVSRLLAKLREEIFATTRQHLQARLRISTAEFESLLRLVRSRLDLSISSLLGSRV